MISLFGRNDKTARYNLLYFFEHNLSGQAFSTRFFSEKEKRAQTLACLELDERPQSFVQAYLKTTVSTQYYRVANQKKVHYFS